MSEDPHKELKERMKLYGLERKEITMEDIEKMLQSKDPKKALEDFICDDCKDSVK